MGLKPCLGKSSVALFINLMEEDKCQWKEKSIKQRTPQKRGSLLLT
jgi:hypothetical protein